MIDKIIHKWLNIPYKLNYRLINSDNPVATVLFLHGIGNSGVVWRQVTDNLVPGARQITVDLLGFGKSPKPEWVKYDVKVQAQAVMRTLLALGINQKIIIVGHSLGALVAIELAKQYPKLASSLVLFSPPLYDLSASNKKLLPSADKILIDIYRIAERNPRQFLKVSGLAMQLELINQSFSVTDKNVKIYLAALKAAIINQTSLKDIYQLKLPIYIMRGKLDPVLVPKRIKKLSQDKSNIELITIMAGHEVKGYFARRASELINKIILLYNKNSESAIKTKD